MMTSNEILGQQRRIELARERKARKIVEFVIQDVITQAIHVLRDMEDDRWLNLCAKAEVNAAKVPSEESKQMVIEMLRDKVQQL